MQLKAVGEETTRTRQRRPSACLVFAPYLSLLYINNDTPSAVFSWSAVCLSRPSCCCVVTVCFRAGRWLFACCETPEQVSYSCKCSFYEIFNEKVFDLVDESNRDNPMGLTVREDTRKGVYVEGLMEEDVSKGDKKSTEVQHQRGDLSVPLTAVNNAATDGRLHY